MDAYGFNRYPTFTNHGRAIRWQLSLDWTNESEPKESICKPSTYESSFQKMNYKTEARL